MKKHEGRSPGSLLDDRSRHKAIYSTSSDKFELCNGEEEGNWPGRHALQFRILLFALVGSNQGGVDA
jgi:hypothetical protein